MSFSYEPMTEEQCEKERQFPLLEPGIYNFTVNKAEYKRSHKGTPMIELNLTIWDEHGKEYHVFDYLIATPKMEWKTRHFCDSIGLTKEYDDKKFNEHLCVNRSGKAEVIFQKGKAKDGGGFYKDKNAIEDYVMTDQGAQKQTTANVDDFKDDSIPF